MAKKLQITLTRSLIGRHRNSTCNSESTWATKMNQTVDHEDNVAIRGMINRVSHLVKVKEIE